SLYSIHVFFSIIRCPQSLTLFPYTTLFRSRAAGRREADQRERAGHRRDQQGSGQGVATGALPRRPAVPPQRAPDPHPPVADREQDRKSTRLNSSHVKISYAVFCLKKKKTT